MEDIDYSKLVRPDYNSMDLEPDTIYAYLTLGSRTPQNDDERELLERNQKDQKRGIYGRHTFKRYLTKKTSTS